MMKADAINKDAKQGRHTDDEPIVLKCEACGAPLTYDVYHQNYSCSFCGAKSKAEHVIAERRGWVRAHNVKNATEALNLSKRFYSCRSCGAQIVVPKGEVLGRCEFCGGKVVARDYAESDILPDVVIPFLLTPREAMQRLDEWCDTHKDCPEAEVIRQQKKKLVGYYLPYQLVKGPLNTAVNRAGCEKWYDVRTYLNEIAVNTSAELRNDLLDAVEPFDWADAQPFSFEMLGDCKIKLQNMNDKALNNRINEEVKDDFIKVLKGSFDTDDLTVKFPQHDMLVMAAALPMYLVDTGKVVMAINGQTGRVAVSKKEVKENYSFLIEPALITLAVGLVTLACNYFFSDTGIDTLAWELTFGLMAIAGIVAFVAYTQAGNSKAEDPILRTKAIKSHRDGFGALKSVDSEEDKPIPEPIVFEKMKSGVGPVLIKFYSSGRIAQWIGWALLINFLPVLVALLLNGFDFGALEWSGPVVWWTLFIPFTYIIYITKVRNGIYDYPEYHYYNKDGSMGAKVPASEFSHQIVASVWGIFKTLMQEGAFIAMFVFVLICLLMCAVITSGIM